MKKLGVILELFNRYDKLLPTLKILGPSRVTVYGRADEAQTAGTVEEIKKMGLDYVAAADEDRDYQIAARDHDLFYVEAAFLYDGGLKAPRSDNILDLNYFHKNRLALSLEGRGKRFVCDTYSLEMMPDENFLRPGIFFLAACEEMMFRGAGRGEILCDPKGLPLMGVSPCGGEIAAVGCPNVTAERLEQGRRSRGELQAELAAKMGVSFDPDLPVVLYMTTQGLEVASLNKGLKRLAQKANIVLKYRTPELAGPFPGYNGLFETKDDHIFPTEDHRLNWLMRQAAEVSLSNPWGGGFYTNLMLGWRMILIHTSQCWDGWSDHPTSFTRILRDAAHLWVKIAYGLAPLHIEATEMILERIRDAAYWERFDRDFPRLARGVLGRFWFGEAAAARAAALVTRVLERGSFRPTPEERAGGLVVPGPVSNEFPTDIRL